MNADMIEKIILEWIGDNYGSQEAEEPCYDIGTLAGHLHEKLQKMGYAEPQYENCPYCGTTDTEPPKGEGDKEWFCNVCGDFFVPLDIQEGAETKPHCENCPNCGAVDTKPPEGYNGDEEWCEWHCNVCGNRFMPSQSNDDYDADEVWNKRVLPSLRNFMESQNND